MGSLIADNSFVVLTVLLVALVILIIVLSALATVFIIGLRRRGNVEENAAVKEVDATIFEHSAPKPNFLVSLPSSFPPTREALGGKDRLPALGSPEDDEDDVPDDDDYVDDEEEKVTFVTEGRDRVRYERSFISKLIQNKDRVKDWYSELKNELLSYDRVRERMSWKRETFRRGRDTIARFTIRGKTLCLMLAADPNKYKGSKYAVEDVSAVGSTSATPCLYRIKSARRAKYARKLIAEVMADLGIVRQPREAVDYYLPYDGTVGLMERGLIKRVVSTMHRTFKIIEIDVDEEAEAAATAEAAAAAEKKALSDKASVEEETAATVDKAEGEETAATADKAESKETAAEERAETSEKKTGSGKKKTSGRKKASAEKSENADEKPDTETSAEAEKTEAADEKKE